ncbi:prophage antirepressor-like protein [Branchiibius hedensis]|uniref:Prophage antirepressor n=1 Tax=Branchiibius hedensis TaxID=672460 RepID=A0A2Y9BN53_9MICO|nr:BRO family protein [Branchiibius hedensis]PWJ22814.1 prophage antirepressor-like protein [Branchiibius hedensis]PWJ23931.1 prophage antirepressor-like protein [Branchiibius hedensis]SSA32749.1 Prophage antirepressor [Branchiibius hedensis]SSA59163.1 Prophage antirepressor [Branchiibius hedensis]
MDLIPFNYGDAQVRVVQIDGEPWFVASDVAKVLGYRDAEKMTRRLDDEDRGTRSVGTPGGEQNMTVISEPGLYSAVLGSQVEGAKLFKRWITHEVIPQIRRAGSYGAVKELSYEEMVLRTIEESQARIAAQADQIKELTPKANAWQRFISSDGDMSASEAAKALTRAGHKLGGLHKLYELCDRSRQEGGLGWFFRNGHGQREAYQRVVEQGLIRMKPGTYENSHTGQQHTTVTPRFTAKALDVIAKHLGEAA